MQAELLVKLFADSRHFRSHSPHNIDIIRKPLHWAHAVYFSTVCSESRSTLVKGVGSEVHERLYWIYWIKQLHTLPVLHFNRYLTTEYSETTAHFNGNIDTDNHIYVP
jgi:hypothetical protein